MDWPHYSQTYINELYRLKKYIGLIRLIWSFRIIKHRQIIFDNILKNPIYEFPRLLACNWKCWFVLILLKRLNNMRQICSAGSTHLIICDSQLKWFATTWAFEGLLHRWWFFLKTRFWTIAEEFISVSWIRFVP